MVNIHAITISDTTYNVVEASAVNQKKLLTLLSGRLIAGSAASNSAIDTTLLIAALTTLEEPVLDQVGNIALHQVVESGGEVKVTIDDFQGKINSYFILLAEAIRVNLSDFFEWLDTVNQQERAKTTKK